MNKKTIYALGFFDGVHLGHQALLKACCALAADTGCRAGVVTFVGHPQSLLSGTAPVLINTTEDRKQLLYTYGAEVVVELPFDEALMHTHWSSFLQQLVEYGAAGFVCGSDFRFGAGGSGTAKKLEAFCSSRGLPCAVVPQQLLDGIRISSTHIRTLLESGQTETASKFLGHPYTISGEVVSGRRLGRTLGIPTANLLVPEGVVQLRYGVYACTAFADGKVYEAVTNVGNRPTVGGHRVTVEPWLLDFDGDLYGKTLVLSFYRFLRPEQKFPSLDALKEEIVKNAAETRKYFENNTK